MSKSNQPHYERYLERRRQFEGTDEEYQEKLTQEHYIDKSYMASHFLVFIYTINQDLANRLHDAYRKAIVAATDGVGNVDELIAETKLPEAKMAANDKPLQSDDVLLKSFSEEAEKTAEMMVSLLETKKEVGRRIHYIMSDVILKTFFYARPTVGDGQSSHPKK